MKPLHAVACAALCVATVLRAAPGDLDPVFRAGLGVGLTPASYPTFDSGTGATNAVALQSDGRILAGGNVSRFNNSGALTALKRLNADGTLDTLFNPGGAGLGVTSGDPEVNALLVAPDDKIYVGGTFSSYNGVARGGFARLNADGSLDTSFVFSALGGSVRYVDAIALQADGKVLIAGAFSSVNGTSRFNVARLNADGSLDTSFVPVGYSLNGSIRALALAPDGSIYVGGTNYNAATQRNDAILHRLRADGSRDLSFDPQFGADYGAVNALLLLSDGRVVAAGDLPLSGYASHLSVAAFSSAGLLDTSFANHVASGVTDGTGIALALASDGRLLAGGVFTQFAGASRASAVRLNLDGTVESSFAPAPYAARDAGYLTHAYSFAVQPDGRILMGGWFQRVTDPAIETYNLTRFEGDYTVGPGTIALSGTGFSVNENADPGRVAVARFAGLVGSVSVDYAVTAGTATAADFTSTAGTLTWANGEGGVKYITVPITNDAVAESLETAIITLSNVTGGAALGTALGTLSIRDDDSLPQIVVQPAALNVDQGDSITLFVGYDSVLPATVQWYLGTTAISGATSLSYFVSAADPALHAGNYSVQITNANGTTTSATVAVTVKIPAGAVVASFAPAITLNPIYSAGLDPAGNILVGGASGVMRLTAAGVVDPSFTPVFNGLVSAVVPLPDGSLLAGGSFTTVNSTSRSYFAHVNANGTLDTAINFSLTQPVNVLSIGAGSKLYLGHSGSQGLKRFTLAGTLDATFTASTVGTGTSGIVYNVRERADGKVLVAAQAGGSGSVSYQFLLLDNPGVVNTSFTAPALNWNVYDWDFLPDGRLVVVGRFSTVGGVAAQRIVYLNADGTRDTSVDFSSAFDGPVTGVRFLNGRLLVWGSFTSYQGYAQTGIARLNLDGTRDTTFKIGAGANAAVNTVVPFADGRIFLGGAFSSLRGLTRNRAALLEAGPGAIAVQPAAISATEGAGAVAVTVKRFAPASGAVSVSYATVAGTATSSGDFTAVAGVLSWADGDVTDRTVTIPLIDDATGESNETFTLALSSLSGEATLAAASSTITLVDDDNPPTILTPPQTQTVAQNAATSFTVVATSTPAATYRWTFNNVDLADGAGITGSGTATLSIAAAGPEHIGTYRVRVTNANGTVTSGPADLVVTLNPALRDYTWTATPAVNGRVNVILPLPDGGAYIGGQFTNFGGQTGRSYLVRISSNGTVNTTFSPAPNGSVLQLALVGNTLYVLADFTSPFSQIGGGAANGFAALDATTGARLTSFMTNLGTGAGGTQRALAVFPDGDVLLGGDFTSFNNNLNHRYLARLNPDGTLDTNWNTSQATTTSGTALVVTAATVGPDGKVIAGGTISYQGGSRFLRLNADGARDLTFIPDVSVSSTSPTRIKVLADGRIMATGTALPPSSRTFTRISSTGAWSSTEFFGATSGNFYDFALQRNGRSIGVGQFTFVRTPSGSGNVSHISRYDSTGNYEGSWPTGAGFDNSAYALALAEDGKIWVGGDFTTYNGVAAQRLIRLNGEAIPLAITLHPVAQVVNPSAAAIFTARATGTTAISYQWRKDGTPLADGGNISGATTPQLSIANAAVSDEGLYTLRVSNASGEEISVGAELVVLGAPEILTQPDAAISAYANRTYSLEVNARGLAPLSYAWFKDDVALVEGAGGITGTNTAKLSFANLTANDAGTYHVVITNSSGVHTSNHYIVMVVPHPMDRAAAFASVLGANPTTVYAILPLADGGALVGGSFNSLNGASSTLSGGRLARILPNGQVQAMPFTLNSDVYTILRQRDGKFLVGGAFTLATPTGQSSLTRNRLLRLNADFSLDPTFDVGTGPTGSPIRALKVDRQGRIYAAGDFTAWAGRPTNNYLVRLLPNGSVDATFSTPLNNSVLDLELDSADRLYVAGNFTSYQGASYFVRLLGDGARDSSYSPANVSSQVTDLLLQPDGKMLFLLSTGGLRRDNADGTADAGFPALSVSGVTALSLQDDGQIVLGGSFTTYGGFTRSGLVRLSSTGAVDPVLATAGSAPTVNALRVDAYGRIWLGGSFTVFNNDVTNVRSLYVLNGNAVPIAFAQQPADAAVEPGQTANFSVIATGTSPLSYRWLKNGAPLADGGRLSGASTAQLSITSAQLADEGNYSVEISNLAGVRTSTTAELVVLGAPEIMMAPGATARDVGQSVSFSVFARGAGTLQYQWFKDGVALVDGGRISGAATATLSLASLVLNDGGSYTLRITGSAGATTTSPATLSVTFNPAGVATGLVLPTFNNTIYTLLPNNDGTFFAGGLFTSITWSGGSATRNRFAKIKADGSADLTWPTFNSAVYAIAKDGSGRIYLGGAFTSVTLPNSTSVTRNRLVRLNADGSLDTTFNAPGGVGAAGPNSNVKGIKFDPAGRVYVYGEFSLYNGVSAGYVVRLNEDGSRDTAFASPLASFVYDLEFTSDGRIWISHGGTWSGQSRLVLVDATGTKDANFSYAGTMTSFGAGLLTDSSVLSFSSNYPYLQKIGLTGTVATGFPNTDQSFQGPGNSVAQHAASSSGQFYLQGAFTTYGGASVPNVIRINADGSRDTTFAPGSGSGFNGTVETMVVDGQGRLWAAGSFASYNGDTTITKLVVLNGGAAQTYSGPPPDTLGNYLSAAGVPANLRGPNDDPDGDGVPNLLEYALALNPAGADAASLPQAMTASSRLTMTYERARTDVTYVVETSTDLLNWTATGVDQGAPDGDGITTASVAMAGSAQFLRLRVTR